MFNEKEGSERWASYLRYVRSNATQLEASGANGTSLAKPKANGNGKTATSKN